MRVSGLRPAGALACLAPWALASLVEESVELSWWIAWGGSWAIIALVFSGHVFRLPKDRPILDQVLRPWFLMHLVFAGYNFLTSIFYWLDINGITLGFGDPMLGDAIAPELAAKVQRLYVLAHAGLVIGIGLMPQVPIEVRVRPAVSPLTTVLLAVTVGSAVLSLLLGFVPGLGQFQVKMQGLSTVAAAVSLGVAFHEGSRWRPVIVLINAVLLIVAVTSGWKGGPIVMIILIAAALYPKAPMRTLVAAGVILVIGVFALPSISSFIRVTAWRGEMTQVEAFKQSVSDLQAKPLEEVTQDSWNFLAGRLSEAAMFVRYVDQVPEMFPYYRSIIVAQALTSVIPRIVWPEKRDLEDLVRERVLRHGIVASGAEVSAKPQFVVDGYLTFGAIGVFSAMILFGVVAQVACNFCVSRLGGYLLGGVAFNGLFAVLWQGSAFEYVFNAVVWSLVLVFVLHAVGRWVGFLLK